jgi:hypothetical protein
MALGWPHNSSTVGAELMRFLIFVWISLALGAAGGAWYAMRPSRRGTARFWIAICAVLLVAFAASFLMFDDSGENSLLSIAFYLLNWGMAAGGAAICLGTITGLSAALAFKR